VENQITPLATNEIIKVDETERSIEDLEVIHQNLIDVSSQLQEKIPEIIEFAQSAQHPKVFEALAKVVTSISILNRDAANVIRQKHEIRISGKSQNKTIVNNSYSESNIIKMTPNQMMELIRQKTEESI